MKRFAGRWLLAVAAVHTVFAVVMFRADLAGIVRAGFVGAIGADPRRGAVAWFILFGGAIAVAALAIDALEARGASLSGVGLALLALLGLGVLWMPASGFWLAFPAVFAMLRRSRGVTPG